MAIEEDRARVRRRIADMKINRGDDMYLLGYLTTRDPALMDAALDALQAAREHTARLRATPAPAPTTPLELAS
jgi:hypothetical protein